VEKRKEYRVHKKVQKAIDKVVGWAYDWGFKFSIEKTQTVFYTRKRIQEKIKVMMYRRELERVSSIKFLGVILDARLAFSEHIKKMEDKCKKVIKVIRCLTRREWGASRSSLKSIKGSIVVGSATRSLLMRLEVIQNQVLRICCGAFKTSSAPAIQVEMGELTLELRRIQLMANYWAGFHGQNDSHPTKAF